MAARKSKPIPATYEITRTAFLRSLGVVFLLAFGSLGPQLSGLIGPEGVLPLDRHLHRLAAVIAANPWSGNEFVDRFASVPTLLWFLPPDIGPWVLTGIGMVAALVLALGRFQAPMLLICWLTWLSVSLGGQRFLQFQWDTLLTEVGFAALLVAPWGWRPAAQAPMVGWWLLRWILFRLVFFGGLVKLLSGDPTWRDLTALAFHYETQPLPNPISWWMHWLPLNLHRASTLLTFVIELVLVFGIFGNRTTRRVAFVSISMLMALLFVTGNYGYFQILTLVLALTLLDDEEWRALTRRKDRPTPLPRPHLFAQGTTTAVAAFLFATSLVGAVPRYSGIETPRVLQRWYVASVPWRTVNHYGLFARMTTTRPIPVLEARWDDGEWTELTWAWQTSDPGRSPRFVAPHMPRVDWLVWFAGLGKCESNRWFLELQRKLVQGSEPVAELVGDLRLVARPPTEVRSVLYDYRFVREDSKEDKMGLWWVREEIGPYCPAVAR